MALMAPLWWHWAISCYLRTCMSREPITYTIEKGWITDIRGGLDAELVKS